LGPIASGALSDVAGGLEIGLALSTGVLTVSVLIAFLQRTVSAIGVTGKVDAEHLGRQRR
ncbi:MAG: hypothetical protein ACR2OU_07330, partial [Thermomicrobiales bacterium]